MFGIIFVAMLCLCMYLSTHMFLITFSSSFNMFPFFPQENFIFSLSLHIHGSLAKSMCIAPPSFAMSYINLPFHCLCRLLLYFYYLIFILVSYCFLGCHLTFAGKSRLCNGYKAEWFNLNYIFFW